MDSWSNEICHFVVMMQNIPQRRYIRAVGNLTNFEISCTGKIYEFSPKASVKFSPLSKYFHTRSIYTLKLRTSMLSWLRTTAATEWLARYLFNTQSQLICIIVAQPNIQLRLCMFQRNRRWQGWMVGRKNNWRGRLLKYTDEFNEWTYKCNFCANDIIRKLTPKFNNLPRPLKVGLRHRKLIPKRLTYVEKFLQPKG